jgi:hypothetical protein
LDVGAKKLLRAGNPKADESLLGYVTRLSEENGYENPSWIFELAGLKCRQPTSSSKLVFGNSRSVTGIAEISGKDVIDITRLTYPAIAKSEAVADHLFFGQSTPKFAIRPGYPKICPDCLSGEPYSRRVWEFLLVTTCPIHKRLLIDECPRCRKLILPVRKTVNICCRCKADWREFRAKQVAETDLALTRHVHRICGLSIDREPNCEPADRNPALNFTLEELLLAVVFIAGHYKGISSITNKYLDPKGNNKELHAIFTKAYSVFEDWPHNYYRFLDWLCSQERNLPLIRQRLKSALYRDFGKFYPHLYNMLSESPFEFMRSAFVEYLAKKWKGNCLSDSNKKGDRASNLRDRYVLKTDAARLLETDFREIDRLVEADKLKITIRSKGKRRLVLVEITGIVKLRFKRGL